jgi:hypothetical protein
VVEEFYPEGDVPLDKDEIALPLPAEKAAQSSLVNKLEIRTANLESNAR